VLYPESVDSPQNQRKDIPFIGLIDENVHSQSAVLREVLHQLFVVVLQPQQRGHCKDQHHEKYEQNDRVCHFVSEVGAEKALQLAKDVEGELLDVALEGHEENDGEKGVLSEKDGHSVPKEQCEELIEHKKVEEHERQLKVQEIEVVGEEPDSVVVLGEEVAVSVVILLRELIEEIVIGVVYAQTDLTRGQTHLDEQKAEAALILGEFCIFLEKHLRVICVVLMVVVVEIKAVKEIEIASQVVQYDTITWYFVND